MTQPNQSELRKQLKTYNWSSDKDYQVACIAFKELITANYIPTSEVAEREQEAYKRGYIDGGIAELTKDVT